MTMRVQQLLPWSLSLVVLPGAALACPSSATTLLNGLYRWQLQRQDQPGPVRIDSQRSRFTPELFQQLEQAYALPPSTGRFVDFDLFSGTQVTTLGARVMGCQTLSAGRLLARIDVRAGLRGRGNDPPQQLRYELVDWGPNGWRIADIVYPGAPSLRLSTYLSKLLAPQR